MSTDWPQDWHGRRVAYTTSIPVEVLVAAGSVPVDLNNIFITSPEPSALVARAERAGLPRTICGWIKGIYAAAMAADDIEAIIAVTQGDCSNTHALIELFQYQGRRVVPFAYPYDRSRPVLRAEVDKLLDIFGVSYHEVGVAKSRLDGIRAKLLRLDELTWCEDKVTGAENHTWLVSASDFKSDPDGFEADLDDFMTEAESRDPEADGIRLGYLGVPPVWNDFYEFVEQEGTRVVFNEMQRQYAMLPSIEVPGAGEEGTPEDALLAQYLRYTYPYDVFARIEDIRTEIHRRRLDGLIHYVQSFCFRQLEDLLLRKELHVPLLTIEGDRPGPLEAPVQTRIESFREMLSERQPRGGKP